MFDSKKVQFLSSDDLDEILRAMGFRPTMEELQEILEEIDEDGSGEIGIIASVTNPFCGDCTRVRLSTDGKIFTCLFASDGISLMEPMRAGASDEELRKTIAHIWNARSDKYSEDRAANPSERGGPRKIEMYQIGG